MKQSGKLGPKMNPVRVGNFLSGLQHRVPNIKGRMQESWKWWRVRGEKEIPCRAPPLTKSVVLAMSGYLAGQGHLSVGLSICLGFHRFLRTSELTNLRLGQFAFNGDHTEMHVVLPFTKSSRRRGINDSIHVDDSGLSRRFWTLIRGRQPGDVVMECSAHKFRVLFEAAKNHLGVPDDVKPCSLRRGGATAYFQEHGSFEKAMEVGRWNNLQTARIYINTALLSLARMSELEFVKIAIYAKWFCDFITVDQ